MSGYKKIAKADQKNTEGGYKNVVLFAPVTDFLSIKGPTATPLVLGDKKKVILAHTFGVNDGWISLLCKKHSVTSTSESGGDDGSQSLTHKAKFVILGDSASTLETMEEMLNDDILWLIKDQDCINATDYVQFGDDCLQADHKISFDGKTTKEGLKEYTIEISVKAKKFFYSGAVTEKPVVAPSYPAPTVAIVTGGPISQAPNSILTLLVSAYAHNTAPNQYVTVQWKKDGVDILNAFGNFYYKAGIQVADSGSYTAVVTDAYGKTATSGAIVVTIA